jgi:hypothetical protein
MDNPVIVICFQIYKFNCLQSEILLPFYQHRQASDLLEGSIVSDVTQGNLPWGKQQELFSLLPASYWFLSHPWTLKLDTKHSSKPFVDF